MQKIISASYLEYQDILVNKYLYVTSMFPNCKNYIETWHLLKVRCYIFLTKSHRLYPWVLTNELNAFPSLLTFFLSLFFSFFFSKLIFLILHCVSPDLLASTLPLPRLCWHIAMFVGTWPPLTVTRIRRNQQQDVNHTAHVHMCPHTALCAIQKRGWGTWQTIVS